MVESNAILTFEKKERFIDPTECEFPIDPFFFLLTQPLNNANGFLHAAPDVRIEEVCVSMVGFIIALIITALLALVAVAVAVSCWLMAYRRRPKIPGPLPHPPDFPNPLFTTPEPLAEPSPDYLS